jgi:hypothetical protein
VLVIPNVEIPETLSCCDVKLVADVIPKVLIPETLSCCDVKFVVLVIPKVLIPETLSCCDVKFVVLVTPRVLIPVALMPIKEILSSRLNVNVLPEPTEVRLIPPEIVKVSLRRLISTEPESPATVKAVPTAAVDTAVTRPLALTVTTGIKVCEPNVPVLLLTVANVVTVLTEVISPVKFGILVVVVAVPAFRIFVSPEPSPK